MTYTSWILIGLLYSAIGNLYADFVMKKYYKMMHDMIEVDPYDHGGRTWLRRALRRVFLTSFWPLFITNLILDISLRTFEYTFMAMSIDRVKLAKKDDNKFGDKK